MTGLMREERVNGYNEYQKTLQQVKVEGYDKIWVLFCGTLKDSGESWCGDCTRALPVIDRGVRQLNEKLQTSNSGKAVYIFVSIDRDVWKGSNQFREDLKLTAIPTVIHWEGGVEKVRLVEEECSLSEKVLATFDI